MTLTPEEIEAEHRKFLKYMNEPVAARQSLSGGEPVDSAYFNEWDAWLAAIASERDRRKHEQDAADKVSEGIFDPFCNWVSE